MIHVLWRGVAAMILAGGVQVFGYTSASAAGAVALAYVASGQVVVQENGVLTTVGAGQDPVWSPSGANLLYMNPDFVGGAAQLYVADSHGANSRLLLKDSYPWVRPSWSVDGKSVVYTAVAPTSKANAAHLTLEVRAASLAGGGIRSLGHVTFVGGCKNTSSALQDAMGQAQGGYRGTPSTLIWSKSNMVVVQSSCTGMGLTAFSVGSNKVTSLPDWSGGVLSPDGRIVAAIAIPTGGKASSAQVGFLNLLTGKHWTIGPKLGSAEVAWAPDATGLLTVTQPSDPQKGLVQVHRLTPDGKSVALLGAIQGAGAYHLALDSTGKSLSMAVVANAPAAVGVPPTVQIYFMSALIPGKASLFSLAGQPAWRPLALTSTQK